LERIILKSGKLDTFSCKVRIYTERVTSRCCIATPKPFLLNKICLNQECRGHRYFDDVLNVGKINVEVSKVGYIFHFRKQEDSREVVILMDCLSALV
jgi:hypothetical protein